jgi:5-methyltetrahydrofolate--homocysteine methyltransferase
MTDDLFASMRQAIIDGDPQHATELANEALASGVPPLDAIERGFVPGLSYVGEQFSLGELFLPDMMLAARAMQQAVKVLEPEMLRSAAVRKVAGHVVLGTVKGDIHEIGKNLVGMMLSTEGFAVHDLGVDVAPEQFVAAVREHDADIVGVSALLTTTMAGQRAVIEALDAAGLRPRVKVIVGGAPASETWAAEIGADGFSEDAIGAVALAKRLVGGPSAAVPGVVVAG